MSPESNDRWRPPEPPGRPPRPPSPPRAPTSRSRWLPWVFLGLLVTALLVYQGLPKSSSSQASLTYSQFLTQVRADKVATIKYDSSSGHITGQFKKGQNFEGKTTFAATGPRNQMPDEDIKLLNLKGVDLQMCVDGPKKTFQRRSGSATTSPSSTTEANRVRSASVLAVARRLVIACNCRSSPQTSTAFVAVPVVLAVAHRRDLTVTTVPAALPCTANSSRGHGETMLTAAGS